MNYIYFLNFFNTKIVKKICFGIGPAES